MLQSAIEIEVAEYIERLKTERNSRSRCLVVRNGFMPSREIVTGVGPLAVRQPRVRDKRAGETITSNILPRYMRRVPSVDALIRFFT